jgi:uncharacterized protein (UPF0147 family)
MKILKEVQSHLLVAVEAGKTVLASCKAAAHAAKGQLDSTIESPDARAAKVVELYKTVYGNDHNVKANFKDALYLYACGMQPISFIDRKGQEQHTTAKEAVDLSKHDMKKAIKELRDELGEGRKNGGGRKPRTPTTAPAKGEIAAPAVNATPQVIAHTAEKAREAFLAKIATGLKDDKFVAELRAVLLDNGYQLRKKAQHKDH